MTTETLETPGAPDTEAPIIESTNDEPNAKTDLPEPEVIPDDAAKEEKPVARTETPKWVQKRIDQITARAKAAEAKVAEFESGQAVSNKKPDAREEAREAIRFERFIEDCNSVASKGIEVHKEKFAQARYSLSQVFGDDVGSFYEAVVDGKNPEMSADVIVYFGDNPSEADAFADLNARAQGEKLALLKLKLAGKKTAKASNAPSPVSAVSGTGRSSNSAAGTSDEADWYARREAEVKKRR